MPESTRRDSWLSLLPLALYHLIVLAYLAPTFFMWMWTGHELVFPHVRVMLMARVWEAQGPFHTPWLPEIAEGYGWPVFTFYAPLGYYVATAAHEWFGLGVAWATKLSYYLSLYLGGLFVYCWIAAMGRREGWPRTGAWALCCAVIYNFAPFHQMDMFGRSALSECWAWATLPAILWGAELTRTKPAAGWFITALGSWALIIGHNISALYGAIFIALYVLLTAHRIAWPFIVASAGFAGAILATYLWYPALRLTSLTLAGQPENFEADADWLHEHALFWIQHLIELHGKGFSIANSVDLGGYAAGYMVLAGLVCAVIALVRPGLTRYQRWRLGALLGIVGLLFFMMSRQMPWQYVPRFFYYLQFPWRLLIFTTLFGVGALGAAVPVINRRINPYLFTALASITGIVIGNVYYFVEYPVDAAPPGAPEEEMIWAEYLQEGEAHGWYGGNIKAEYLPVTADRTFINPAFYAAYDPPPHRLEMIEGDLRIYSYSREGVEYYYEYYAENPAKARMHVFWFPGWKLEVDGMPRPDLLGRDELGLLTVQFPMGMRRAKIYYDITDTGRLALWISYAGWTVFGAAALFALIGSLVSRRRGATGARPDSDADDSEARAVETAEPTGDAAGTDDAPEEFEIDRSG